MMSQIVYVMSKFVYIVPPDDACYQITLANALVVEFLHIETQGLGYNHNTPS